MFEDKLASFLRTWPGLAALEGERVYPEELPELPVLPAMVFHEVSCVPTYSHGGDSGLDEAVMQFSCWGNSPRDAKRMADALRDALPAKVYWQSAFIELRFARPDAETGLSREVVMVRFQIGR